MPIDADTLRLRSAEDMDVATRESGNAARRRTSPAGTTRCTVVADTSAPMSRRPWKRERVLYEPAGTAANLAVSRQWVNEQASGKDPAV